MRQKVLSRTLSFLLVAAMLCGYLPSIPSLVTDAKAAGNYTSSFEGQDADVFSALGFNTSVLPEG